MLVYGGDLLITGEKQEVNRLLKNLKKEFKARQMNEAKNFLGTPINRTENKIIIKKQFYRQTAKVIWSGWV